MTGMDSNISTPQNPQDIADELLREDREKHEAATGCLNPKVTAKRIKRARADESLRQIKLDHQQNFKCQVRLSFQDTWTAYDGVHGCLELDLSSHYQHR